MPFDALMGRISKLTVRRIAAPGALLEVDGSDAPGGALLVPRREVPEHVQEGDELEVFVYRDSEDRPIATTLVPKLTLHDVAFVEVTDSNRVGAFVDIGLQKELLVPFAEQTRELKKGDFEFIGMRLDPRARLVGTMRTRELLADGGDFSLNEWVTGEAWRNDPELGLFVILERKFIGLLPAYEPHALRRGQTESFRIVHVHRDGKVELSLRAVSHEQLEDDARTVLELLERGASASNESPPEHIRGVFGLSKKAFKRAVGRLLREGAVDIDDKGRIAPRR